MFAITKADAHANFLTASYATDLANEDVRCAAVAGGNELYEDASLSVALQRAATARAHEQAALAIWRSTSKPDLLP